MIPTREEILNQFRRIVVDTPDENFDMRILGETYKCGTVGCLLGNARLDPWFQENTMITDVIDIEDDMVFPDRIYKLNGIDCVFAGMFRMSFQDANNLFGLKLGEEDEPVPKRLVLDNIDRMLRGEPAISYPGGE